ncbi:MAG TPA: hypothetical protein VG652_07460 [Gaiellaceae bacterium]|nr:hypothetical protein [Gaiellaceae bacterium]
MSPSKKRQTMGKMTRERELRERRAMKQEKKDGKKLAAATEPVEGVEAVDLPDDSLDAPVL